MTDMDERIRRAYGPVEVGADERRATWAAVASPSTLDRRRRRPRVSGRGLVAIAVALVSLSSVALARQDVVQQLFGHDPSRPADRMRVFREQEPLGTRGLAVEADGRLRVAAPGMFRPKELRHVLTYRTGSLRVQLRSAPAPDGQACFYVEVSTGMAGLSCTGSMRFNGHVSVVSLGDRTSGTLITGLVDDEVTGVRVRVTATRTVAAQVQRNGFLAHLPEFAAVPHGLLVTLRDGSVLDLTMSGCLRSQLEPPRRSNLGCGFGMNRGPEDAG